MSDRADVVVVGGGIQGAAVALHLLEAGVGSVRLLERDGLFEATSSAGAGFVAVWAAISARPYGEDEVAVERYGLSFYRDLHDRGHDIDFAQNGLLLAAVTEPAFEEFKSIRQEHFDPATVVVDRERIEELTSGAMLADGVTGGVYQPAAAQIFTPKVGRALKARLLEEGGIIEPRRPALGLRSEQGRVTGVETPTGTVDADAIVLAAGAWTNELLRGHAAPLPYVPQLTSRIITEPLDVPQTLPALMLSGVISDGPRLWIREHEGGLLWGGVHSGHPRDIFAGADPLPTRVDEVPLDGVLELQRVARAAAGVMPALGRYESMTLKHGLPCFTADQRALVGPVPGLHGLYAMAGDNEAGVTHGPGFAKVLADEIVSGSSDLARLDSWRLDRFSRELARP